MEPISRRSVLTMGGLGLLSTVIGGTGLWRELNLSTAAREAGQPWAEPEIRRSEAARPWAEPEIRRSEAGLLEVRLEAALGTHEIAGRPATTLGYNGGVPGPTLRLRPGDTLRIDLVNHLEEATNLHVHGLHVSPEDDGDNVFLAVGTGQTQRYEYRLPDDHPSGVFWYHPHHHGNVADQVFGGLYGAIIIEDPADEIDVDRERVMVVADTTLDRTGSLVTPSIMEQMMGREGELVLINGQTAPVLEGRAGERERWRIINACASRYLALDLPDQDVTILGRDQGRLAEPAALGDVVLAPGNRLDLLVDLREGNRELTALPVDRGGMMGGMGGGMMGGMRGNGPGQGMDGPVSLAQLRVTAGDRAGRRAIPAAPSLRDLRDTEVVRRRTITFEMGMGGMMGRGGGPMSFTIDGLEFDADRIDQEVELGTVEEWTIGNDSPMDHPFHLHVWPMQVLELDGQTATDPLWLDVVNVPAGGQVTVRVPFEDFGGKTVYHCHILDHEDRGMMGTVLAR